MEDVRKNSRIVNTAALFIILVLSVYVLSIGKAVLVPFVIAVVLFYLIIGLMQALRQIKLKEKKMPRSLAMGLALASVVILITLFVLLVKNSFDQVLLEADSYQEKLDELLVNLYQFFGVEDVGGVSELIGQIDLSSILTDIIQALRNLASNVGLIIIYVAFLLVEYRGFGKKFKTLAKKFERFEEFDRTLVRIGNDVDTYIKIKTLVSVLTGVFSYILMVLVGVDFAEFWAFLIFLLNYIPVIGSLIGVSFPILLSLVQFPTLLPFVVMTVGLFIVQFTMSQIVEPRLLGSSLNLSPLAIIFALVLWTHIWGPIGAIICVPITVIINIILAKFETTRPIAMMLSANGKVD